MQYVPNDGRLSRSHGQWLIECHMTMRTRRPSTEIDLVFRKLFGSE